MAGLRLLVCLRSQLWARAPLRPCSLCAGFASSIAQQLAVWSEHSVTQDRLLLFGGQFILDWLLDKAVRGSDTQDQQAAEMARRCGIKRIVKLSSFDSRKNVGTGKWHAAGESVIRATGIDFTFV